MDIAADHAEVQMWSGSDTTPKIIGHSTFPQNYLGFPRLSVRYTQSRKSCNLNSFPRAQGQGYVTWGHEKSAYGLSGFLMTPGHMTVNPGKNSWINVAILSRLRVHASPVKLQHGREVSGELLLGLQKWFSCKSVQKCGRKWLEVTGFYTLSQKKRNILEVAFLLEKSVYQWIWAYTSFRKCSW